MKVFSRGARTIFWLSLVVILTLPVGVSGVLAETLTLEQALTLARADNPALAEARARIAQARATLAESRAAFWPRLDAGLEYLRGDAPSAYLFKTIDARRLPPQVDFNDPGRFDNIETSLSARLNLFAGGLDRLRLRQAGLLVEQARYDHGALENDLSAVVIDTFLALLSARDLVDIARQSVDVLTREVELAEVRFAGGSLLRSELLSLNVRLAEAQSERVRAQGAENRLQAALAVLLGRETSLTWQPVPEPFTYAPPADFESAVRLALRRRPEPGRAARGRDLAELEHGMARSEYLPRLDLHARLYHDDPDFSYNDDSLNWTLGAQLSWNLFSGFATRAREARALGQVQERSEALRRQRLEIEREVRDAWLSLEEAQAVETWAQAALSQARQAFAQVQTRFSGGAADVTRYLDAELTWHRSQINAAAASRDRQRALAALARALGEWGGLGQPSLSGAPSEERSNDGFNP